MSDTPRTDALAQTCMDTSSEWHGEWVPLEVARGLERDLNEANQTNLTLSEDREELRRQLEESNRRNVTLIEERDSARTQAGHKLRLREELEALLGTADIETGVERVKEAQRRAARYEYVRKLTIHQYGTLLRDCVTFDLRFDDEIDKRRKEP